MCTLLRIGFVGTFLFLSFLLHSQNEYIIIDSIAIEGNKRTKGPIIFRELLFSAGDTITLDQVPQIINSSKQNLLNTQLFNLAEINIKKWKPDNKVNILITVSESWYFFPAPIFELADRNFNVWWVEQNKSLKRINLGARLKYLNMSGHRDELKAILQTGYTEKYELEYTFPYINKAKTIGAFGNIIFSKNKEVNYINAENKQLFYAEKDLDLFKRFRTILGISYRPNFYSTHFLRYEYHSNTVDTLIINRFNAQYFGNSLNKQAFGLIEYAYEYDERDLRIYPRKGYFIQGKLRKIGLFRNDQNHLNIRLLFQFSLPLLKRSAFTNQSIGQTIIEFDKISFNLSKGHGFGDDYLRGFEFYVIDAQRFFINKSKGKLSLLHKTIDFKKWMPIKPLKIMPLQLFLSGNFDFGYFRDEYYKELSPLANKWLYSFGVGIDLVLYNNYAYTIEYSINQFQEKGIFLHLNVGL